MSPSKIEYNRLGYDKIVEHPIVSGMLKANAKLPSSSIYHYDQEYANGHGYLGIICPLYQCLAKNNVTAEVILLVHPGDFTGTTHAQKLKYKQETKVWLEYK